MKIDHAIALMKNKDQKGLMFLYDNYAAALNGIIVRIVNSEALSEEILQETFLKIWTKIDSYDPRKSTIFTWMARIARNAAIDQKRLKRFEHAQNVISLNPVVHGSSITSNHANLDVEKLMSKLDEKYKIILDHIYLFGYSHTEVAKKLDLPLGTVKSRLRKSILILREELKGEATLFVSWFFIVLLLMLFL